jgi:hypothetical protein
MADGKSGLTKEEQNAGMVAALKREHAAYVRMGKTERAAEVEKQLELRGAKAEKPDSDKVESEKDVRSAAPQGRSTKSQQTAKG